MDTTTPRSLTNLFRLRTKVTGKVLVIRFVDKRFNDEVVVQQMGAELLSLIMNTDFKNFLISFEGVELVNPATLGKIITALKEIREKRGKLKLAGVCPVIYEVFNHTRLDELFDITESEAAALASF